MVEKSYISCIKINGIPIIPPLLTPDLRRECREFREKAVAFERKLMRQQIFKECMDNLQNLQQRTRRLSEPKTLEMQMTVDEFKVATDNSVEINRKKTPNLTRETVEVSEYVSSERINNDSNTQETVLDKPKLVRSASYTLDRPSPILLAHLEKEAKKCSDAVVEKTNHSNETSLEFSSISPETVINSNVQLSEPPKPSYVVETDIKVEQIKITAPVAQKSLVKSAQAPAKDTNIDPILRDILATFPPDSIPKIMEVLNRQNAEQIQHSKSYEDLKRNQSQRRESFTESEPKTNLSISSSQSLYYSVTSDNTITPVPDIHDYNTVNLKNIRNTKRRLVYHNEDDRQRAATQIQAAVRGYLVRRLIKTEKVQILIETIKDALLCAIQLHNTGVIDQSDIELHRRLLQQISAACYAFHDIFFVLSIKEQMSIIATDRQRLIEKAKRPLSRNSRLSQPSPRQILIKSTKI